MFPILKRIYNQLHVDEQFFIYSCTTKHDKILAPKLWHFLSLAVISAEKFSINSLWHISASQGYSDIIFSA